MTEEIIIDGTDVSECEWLNTCSNKIRCVILQNDICCSDNTCRGWKNCYYKQLKRLEQERDELKRACDKCKLFDIEKTNRDLLERIDKLEQENRWQRNEEKYLKDCCIKAGKELEKHSFKWDGKEKNLVVQALQLNQLYEKLEQENKELKDLDKKICEDWEKEIKVYWNALEEIREIANQSCNNCKYNKDDITCSIGDCGEGKLRIIQNKINEVIE